MDVSATGNVRLLIRSGNPTAAMCANQWENVVKANSISQGKQEYTVLLREYKAYNRLLRDYNGIKAHLTILCYSIQWESIQYVRSKGYKIDTTNSKTFAESLAVALNKSNNIISKLITKQNELVRMIDENKKAAEHKETFETLMAALSFNLGYAVADDITLSRYNEYLKIIEKKNHQIKTQKEKQWARN